LTPPKSPLEASPKELAQTIPVPGRRAEANDDNLNEQSPRVPGSIGQPSAPHAAVELQSDPQGADFKPYLAKILGIVRANWHRVVPESARMGTVHGRTVMEFIIDRDGSIPKIVTADSSGSDALDRAALVGLSMSNPLPPLPADFKGAQVRLAFTFSYNLPSQQ
jgi:TonB family protein